MIIAIILIIVAATFLYLNTRIKRNLEVIDNNYLSSAKGCIYAYIKLKGERSASAFDLLQIHLKNSIPTSIITASTSLTHEFGSLYATDYSDTQGIYVFQAKTEQRVDFSAQINIWKSCTIEKIGINGVPIYEGETSIIASQTIQNNLDTMIEDSGITPPLRGNNFSYTKGISNAMGINVEISWPLEEPYKDRQKYIYYFEVFKPNS